DLAERHPEKSDTFAMNVDGASLSPMREPVPSSPDEHVHESEVDGNPLVGSWEDLVRLMRDADQSSRGRTREEYMLQEARRAFRRTGARIPTHDAESFIRASAGAGLLRIVRSAVERTAGPRLQHWIVVVEHWASWVLETARRSVVRR